MNYGQGQLEESEHALRAFKPHQLQTVLNALMLLEEAGVKSENFKDVLSGLLDRTYVPYVQQAEIDGTLTAMMKKRKAFFDGWRDFGLVCPNCKGRMGIRQILAPVGPNNRFGYRSHVFCFKDETGCTEEQFFKKDPHELLKELKQKEKENGTR